MTLEEAALSSLGKLALSLWRIIQGELMLALSAGEEHRNLIVWISVIEEGVLKKASSVQVTDEMHRVALEIMQKFVYDARHAIDKYEQSAREPNGIFNKALDLRHDNIFARDARDAKRKLVRGLETLKDVADLVNDYAGDHVQPSPAVYSSSPIAYSKERNTLLMGIEKRGRELLDWLKGDDSKSKVIFVHGTPGLGKTSLVGAVLRTQEMRECFRYYVWIKDLRSCELTNNISQALMKANAIIWERTDDGNEQEFQMELEDVFTLMRVETNIKSRWVLVLDDASKATVLECLEMPISETHPSVLVTTRISSLASFSSSCLASLRAQTNGASPELFKRLYVIHNFKLAGLSVDDSYKLFCQYMPDNYECAKKPKTFFDSILKRCGGSPLAIKAMCEHLIHKQGGDDVPQFVEWETWSRSLQFSSLSNYAEEGSIRRMMTKCRDHLDDVQNCFLYLSIFPLDCPLRYSTLMRLWMAEGFSEKTLINLVERNFFKEVKRTSYGKIGTCRLNNLLHQIIISKSINDKFAMIVAGQKENWPDDIRRLSLHNKPKSEVKAMRVGSLISLHASKEEVCRESMGRLLNQVKKLKVLDLQRHLTKVRKDLDSPTLPKKVLRLKYLNYLSLRDTKVRDIPDDIGNLQGLETLDLKGTHVIKLPDGILKLKKLRYLLVYRSDRPLAAGTAPKHGVKVPSLLTDPKHGVKVPSKLGLLISLQKLCMIDLDPVKRYQKRKVLLKEIGKLTHLQRLGISMMRSTDVWLLFSSIGELTNLEALRLIAAPGESIYLSAENVRRLPKNLKRVHLTGRLETSPYEILHLTNVVKLVLKGSELKDPLQHLQELHHLKHLELQQAFDETELRFTASGFEELRFLGVDDINSLERILVDKDALPVLETLSLARCTSLEPALADITRPRKLKCLKLYDMCEEFNRLVMGNGNVPARIEVECKERKDGTIEDVIERRRTNGAR